MRRRNGLDGILIETTGLADPAPVAQTFFVDEDVRSNAKLDAIVTVADAKRLFGALDESHEAQEQIAFADVVLLNKTDLVFSGELEQVRGRIRAINPSAAIRETQRCEIELSELLGRDAFNLARVLAVEPDFLEGDHDHEHDDRVSSLSLTSERPLDPQKFMPWIQEITQVFGREILRMKGILAFPNDPDRFVVQGVHMLLEGDRQRAWRPGEARASRLVFIGRDLPKDALRAGFEKCIAVN
jgi:G3E family GTPase